MTTEEIAGIICEEHARFLETGKPAATVADTWSWKAAKRIADQDWMKRYTLPCDVHLPPNTIIRKGCEFKTLVAGLIAREDIGS